MEYPLDQYFYDMYISGYFGRFIYTVQEFKRMHNLDMEESKIAWGLLLPAEIAEFTRRYEQFIQPHGVEIKKEIKTPAVIHRVAERKRKLTSPVYPIKPVDYKECKIVWDPLNNDCKSYGNKSTHGTNLTSILFKNCLLKKDEYYRNTTSILMHTINKHLIDIYNTYATFNDFDNLAAHIVFMGIDYYKKVIANPSIIIPTLVSEDYVKLWDLYLAAL
jgi:hypothetical protein